MSKALTIFRGILKWTAYLLLTVIFLFALLVIALRIPAVQTRLTQSLAQQLSERTGAEINIGNLFLTYSGGVELDEIFVGQTSQDTIIYAHHIDTRVAVMPLFNGNIQVSYLNLNAARVNIFHSEDSVYNFQFIINSFSSEGATTGDSANDKKKSSLPELSVGSVQLRDCHFTYIDSVLGVLVSTDAARLDVLPGQLDLNHLRFFAHQVVLDSSKTLVELFKPIPPGEDDKEIILPVAGCSNLTITDSKFSYHSVPHEQTISVDCPLLELGETRVELPDSSISVGLLSTQELDLMYETMSNPTSSQNLESTAFTLPGWKVTSAGIELKRSNLRYQVIGASSPKNNFNPNDLSISELNLNLGKSYYSPKTQGLDLQKLSFLLDEEFEISNLHTRLASDNNSLVFEDLFLEVQNSSLSGRVNLGFDDLSTLISQPVQSTSVDISLDQARVRLEDLLYFNSQLDTLPYWEQLSAYPILLSGNIGGRVKDLSISELEIKALGNTSLMASASITGLPEPDDLKIIVDMARLHTDIGDVALVLDTADMVLPSTMDLNLRGQGSSDALNASYHLQTDLGASDGQFELANLNGKIEYDLEISLISSHIGSLVGLSGLEGVSGTFQLTGTGADPYSMSSSFEAEFEELIFNAYDYHQAKLNANLEHGNLNLKLTHRSRELVMASTLTGILDSLDSDLTLELNLEGADLQALGLSNQKIKTSFKMEVGLVGSPSDYSLQTFADRIFVIGRSGTYRADSIFLGLHNRADSIDLMVHSGIMRGEMHSNRNLSDLSDDLAHYLGLKLREVWDSTDEHQDLNLYTYFEVNESDFLMDVLLPDLEKLDTIKFEAQFISGSRQLTANLIAPELVYGARSLDNLNLDVRSTADSARAYLEFDRLSGQWIDIRRTELRLERQQKDGFLHLQVMDANGKKDYDVKMALERQDQEFILRLDHDSLVLNEEVWSIPMDNYLRRTSDRIDINNFRLTHDAQKVELRSISTSDQVELLLTDFDLDVIFALLNSSRNLLEGSMNGNVKVVDALKTPGFEADLNIREISLAKQKLGDLKLLADNTRGKEFDLDLDMIGPELELTVNGAYNTDPEVQKINMNFSLQKLGLPLLAGIFPETIDTASGQLTADLSLTGDLKNPDFDGEIQFLKAGVSARQVGGYFLFKDELISIDNSGLSFQRFTIRDENNNLASIKGTVNTKDALNPAFDLELEASDFQLLMAKENSNPLYFGEVLADLNLRITGDLNLPIIRSRVVLQDATNFNYIVPASKTQLESRSGIVEFENVQDTLGFMTLDSEEASRAITGLDLESRIILRRGTQLRMILNPRTGDNLFIKGSSDLELTIKPNGDISLTGIYELNDGGYKLNLFELVNKEFGIRPGSNIVWTGAPMGAELNITAVYEARTSAASLMDDPDPQYNRVLPFEVLLFIKGNVEQPEISFQLDMPPDRRGALGGNVYGKIQEVNLNETELNKQVFALIVFDRFIPSAESGDAGISTADIALSSVGDFVSSQLNNLSEKYLQGVELNVDIGSYTDYGSGVGRERTDLNVSMRKAFFDDRFSVEVGSNVALQGYQPSNEIVGDVALEYKLTEDGRYRLRGYRRNDFENPIEGQVIITGAAVIFSREFGAWSELFRNTTPSDTTQEQNSKPEDE